MDTRLLLLFIGTFLLCLQNIYVQTKRKVNGFVLISYSVAYTLICLAFVISGIFLTDDFRLSDATTFRRLCCGFSGFLLSANRVAISSIALALSIEFFVTLRRSQRPWRTNHALRWLYVFLCVIMPYLSVILGILIQVIGQDPIFNTTDDPGICTISKYGPNRIPLFIALSIPELTPIYPACILSVAALVPVAKKVFQTRRAPSTLELPPPIKEKPRPRPTRAGPPPVSHQKNTRLVVPKNVLVRMGLWCSFLIFTSLPTCTVYLYRSIEYILDPDYTHKIIHILPEDGSFLSNNELELQMLLSILLFLVCFGTGKFAYEQYNELWCRIGCFIFKRRCGLLTHDEESQFDIVYPPMPAACGARHSSEIESRHHHSGSFPFSSYHKVSVDNGGSRSTSTIELRPDTSSPDVKIPTAVLIK